MDWKGDTLRLYKGNESYNTIQLNRHNVDHNQDIYVPSVQEIPAQNINFRDDLDIASPQQESNLYSWGWMDDLDGSPPTKRSRKTNYFYNEASIDDLEDADCKKQSRRGNNLIWVVEKVLEKRLTKDNGIEYKIKWEGFGKKHNTWEPRENVEGLSLVTMFEHKLATESIDGKKSDWREVSYTDAIKENFWKIEKIMGKRRRSGKIQYLVKWEGYSDKSNSWERAERIQDLDVVSAFEEKQSNLNGKLSSVESMKNGSLSTPPINNLTDEILTVIGEIEKLDDNNPALDRTAATSFPNMNDRKSWESHVSAVQDIEKTTLNPKVTPQYDEMTQILDKLSDEMNDVVTKFDFSSSDAVIKGASCEDKSVKVQQATSDPKTKSLEETPMNETDEVYIVEKVLGKRISNKNGIEYKIKWKGFGPKYNTWEPKENVEGLVLIRLFEENATNKSNSANSKSAKQTSYDDAIKENLWEIEKVLKKRIKARKIEYLVKWRDFAEDCNSWEQEKMIKNLDVVKLFEKQHNLSGSLGWNGLLSK